MTSASIAVESPYQSSAALFQKSVFVVVRHLFAETPSFKSSPRDVYGIFPVDDAAHARTTLVESPCESLFSSSLCVANVVDIVFQTVARRRNWRATVSPRSFAFARLTCLVLVCFTDSVVPPLREPFDDDENVEFDSGAPRN